MHYFKIGEGLLSTAVFQADFIQQKKREEAEDEKITAPSYRLRFSEKLTAL